ncbi:hypothetical protein [Acanthopleuribacter pedis]|uniref:Uncharacterized protein n=1 Tax=Acanthopleuribacter pedis TaxID=442870 RepID=A0A8J7U319_9BACT|nr:hypothetical protein [Acanthopleuribacter pedis]MBO1318329.1 hypothetical protein [Acanthopleuribacter pedis]
MNLTAIQQAIKDSVQAGAFESADEALIFAISSLKCAATQSASPEYDEWKRKELDKAIAEADRGELIPHDIVMQEIEEIFHPQEA